MKKTLFLLLALGLCISIPMVGFADEKAAKTEEQTKEVTLEDVKQKASETWNNAKKLTFQEKEEYQEAMGRYIDELSQKAAALKEKSKNASGKALEKINASLDKLKEKQDAAKESLKELKSSTASAWDKIKAKVQGTIEDFKQEVDQAEKAAEAGPEKPQEKKPAEKKPEEKKPE